jgi:hypothetical protein
LDALRVAIDGLAAEVGEWPSGGGCDGESMIDLERQLGRLECIVSASLSRFEASGAWAPEGARSVVAWLATRGHVPKAQARAQLRRGRVSAHLPLLARAWAHGDLGAAQVDVVAKAWRSPNEAAVARDEPLLVHHATELKFEPFCALMAYWGQLADPNGAEASDLEKKSRRDVYLGASLGGMWLGQMTLDPVAGSIVSGELERLEGELFQADWAEARDALGREPRHGELARTSAQRRADALVEMATRSSGALASARRPAPLFSVLVGYETLYGRICQLAGGQVVSPGSLLPWLEGADFERAVFAPGNRVEVSATARLFSGATRRAIELRDQECTHPFCDVPAAQCQIDHIVPYAHGGLTTQENGRVLCGFHNRLRNQGPAPGD